MKIDLGSIKQYIFQDRTGTSNKATAMALMLVVEELRRLNLNIEKVLEGVDVGETFGSGNG